MSISRYEELSNYFDEYDQTRKRLFQMIVDLGSEENSSSGHNFVEHVNQAWGLGIEYGQTQLERETAAKLLWAASLFAVSWYHMSKAHDTFDKLLEDCVDINSCTNVNYLSSYAITDFDVYRKFLLKYADKISEEMTENVANAQQLARNLYKEMFRKRNLVIVDTLFKPLAQARIGKGSLELKPPLNEFVRNGLAMVFGILPRRLGYDNEELSYALHLLVAGLDSKRIYDANSGLWHLGKGFRKLRNKLYLVDL